jgi:predicted PurR-regulated permease PerM
MADDGKLGTPAAVPAAVEVAPAERLRDVLIAISLPTLTVLAILYTAYFAQGLLVPVCVAIILSGVLWPAAAALRRIRIPLAVGAGLATFLPPLIVGALIHYMTPSVETWRYRVPLFIHEMELKLDDALESLQRAREIAREATNMAAGKDPNQPAEEAPQAPAQSDFTLDLLWSLPVALASSAATLILTYFMLVSGPGLALWLVGDPADSRRIMRMAVVARQSLRDISAYYRTVTAINTGLALVVWAAMAAVGMPQPYLWGVMAGVFNFVPYIGPIATGTIIALVALIQFDTTLHILAPPLVFTAITLIEGYFITPWLVGRVLTLNPLLVLLAVIFWGWMWGLAGAFLAVPIVAITVRLIRFVVSETSPTRVVSAAPT